VNTRILPLMMLAALPLAPALAQSEAPPNPAHVESGTYAIDPQHTQVLFAISHMGFTTYYGRFSDASGVLNLSVKDPAASSLEVQVPTSTASTTSEKLNGELKEPAWFDAAKYPQIIFKSVSVTRTAADTANVTGNLTLHGVTKPVTLAVRFIGAGVNPLDKKYTVGFSATGMIRRSEFGMTTYVPLIGDQVELTLSGAFERQG
jgi:polyisoprenoid-binding protein YceI